MHKAHEKRFDSRYRKHLIALKRKGPAESTNNTSTRFTAVLDFG